MQKGLRRKNLPKNSGFLLPIFQGLLTEPATIGYLNSISHPNLILITEDFIRNQTFASVFSLAPCGRGLGVRGKKERRFMNPKPNVPPQVYQSLLNKITIMQTEMEMTRLKKLIEIEELELKLKGLSQRIAYL